MVTKSTKGNYLTSNGYRDETNERLELFANIYSAFCKMFRLFSVHPLKGGGLEYWCPFGCSS